MASVKSRFDATSTSALQQTDGPWLSTYSRGLCSIYPKDEDNCWDYLLSTQSSSIFSRLPDNSSPTPSSIRSKRAVADLAKADKINRSSSTTPSLSSSFPGVSLLADHGATNHTHYASFKGEDSLLVPLSPGSISHALCKIGFDCVDYFTATQEDVAFELPKPTPSPNNCKSNARASGLANASLTLEDLDESDWRTDLAAAVCGKRTAALERKRALSRTMSQEDVMAMPATEPRADPWFETLERLARWDEVAYR